MKESQLQSAILSLLRAHKFVCWRQNMGGVVYTLPNGEFRMRKNPMKGFPDIGGITKTGRLFAIEVKIPGNTTSPEQDMWISRLRESNALVYVLYTLDEAKSVVDVLKAC